MLQKKALLSSIVLHVLLVGVGAFIASWTVTPHTSKPTAQQQPPLIATLWSAPVQSPQVQKKHSTQSMPETMPPPESVPESVSVPEPVTTQEPVPALKEAPATNTGRKLNATQAASEQSVKEVQWAPTSSLSAPPTYEQPPLAENKTIAHGASVEQPEVPHDAPITMGEGTPDDTRIGEDLVAEVVTPSLAQHMNVDPELVSSSLDPVMVYQHRVAELIQKSLRLSETSSGRTCTIGLQIMANGLIVERYRLQGDIALCEDALKAAERIGALPPPPKEIVHGRFHHLKVSVSA